MGESLRISVDALRHEPPFMTRRVAKHHWIIIAGSKFHGVNKSRQHEDWIGQLRVNQLGMKQWNNLDKE